MTKDKVLNTPCPECNADSGEPCTYLKKRKEKWTPRRMYHQSRLAQHNINLLRGQHHD